MTDHAQEQEMEIEALEAILMDEFEEIHASESGLNTSNRCFQITLSPQAFQAVYMIYSITSLVASMTMVIGLMPAMLLVYIPVGAKKKGTQTII